MVNQRDTISAGIVMMFAAAVFIVSQDLASGPSDTPGAGVYPAFIAGCMFLLGIVQIIQSFTLEAAEKDGPELSLPAMKRLLPPFLGLFIYILVMPILGFLISSFLFLVLLMRYSSITDYHKTIPISLAISVGLQYVFGRILRVPLPDGVIPVARLLLFQGQIGVS